MLKIKTSKNVCVIISVLITMLLSILAFSEILLAGENHETIDGKPVLRAILEYSKYPANLTELEQGSDLIIKGIIQDGKENLAVTENFGRTKTKVLVTEVLKGNEDLLNQIIIYREPYYEKIINGVLGYVMDENYEPAIINNEYILFLSNYTGESQVYKDAYTLEYCELGKYLVNENIKRARTSVDAYVDGLSNEELNIGPEKSTFYRKMYKSVIDKYILGNDVSNDEIQEETNPKEISGEPENEKGEKEKTIKTIGFEEYKALNKNGRILLPIRDIAELLECKTDWNAGTKTAVIKRNGEIIEFTIGQKYFTLNGTKYNIDTEAEIYENKTYIPIRGISEAFGIEIDYNNTDKTITVKY